MLGESYAATPVQMSFLRRDGNLEDSIKLSFVDETMQVKGSPDMDDIVTGDDRWLDVLKLLPKVQ